MARKLISFDWAIKYILRDKANFDILEGFLSELLKVDIVIAELIDTETNKETEKDKFNRVDVLAKDSNNTNFLIEIQYSKEIDYFQRIAFGSAKLLSQSITEGKRYKDIKRIITVHIVYFDLGTGKDYLYEGATDFVGIHNKDVLSLTKIQQDMFKVNSVRDIFPKNYLIRLKNYDDTLNDPFDEWVYLLKHNEIKSTFKSKNIEKAAEKLDVLKLNDEARKNYDAYIDYIIFENSLLWSTKEEGKIEGKLEGKIEGKLEGKIEGRLEGILEGKIEIAKNMYKNGLSFEQISTFTGLLIDEIKNIF